MSVRSSYTIPKVVAQQVLIASILTVSDSVLEEMLEALPQSQFRNYSIDEEPNRGPDYHIATVAEFETK
jgi:histidyl-tRNA synthetase